MRIANLIVAAFTGLAAASTLAQPYPAKPIRLISPYPPGGGTDASARIIAQALGEQMGQQVIVDSRAGASGRIGTELAAKSPADGYHLVLGNVAPLAILPASGVKLVYDPVGGFTPISLIANSDYILTVHPSVPTRSVKELVALSKKREEGVNFGSNGTGTTSHLAGIMLTQVAGLSLTHIPFKGASAALVSLVGGEMDLGLPAVTSARPHIAANRLRGLAITTKRLSSVLPDLPTLDSMYPGFDTQ